MLHYARDAILTKAKQDGECLQVAGAFLSPVNDAYGKAGLLSFPQRRAICQLMLCDDPFVAVDDWEGLQSAYQRSYFVLSHVKREVEQHYADILASGRVAVRLYFVCGGDLFETFYRRNCWKVSLLRKIFDDFTLAVACRTGSNDPRDVMTNTTEPITSEDEPGESLDLKPYRQSVVVFALPENATSSTLIRTKLKEGLPLDGLLPPHVEEYLKQEKCYQ